MTFAPHKSFLPNEPVKNTATGGTETTCDQYVIHTFTSNGTFTLTSNGIVDILLVGGGGGGGYNVSGGGGGGGGGVIYEVNQEWSSGSYSVAIGSGGAAGTNGGDTIVSNGGAISYTAKGGGYGGSGTYGLGNYSGNNGGCGGGAAYNFVRSPGAGVAGQGYSGGYAQQKLIRTGGTNFYRRGGGGGGGAGGLGGNAVAVSNGTISGAGGIGVIVNITCSDVYYGGGGSGGCTGPGIASNGGLGGGGNGYASEGATASNGTNGLGGGGGGGGNGYSGGSGIVIIRYIA
jgi:hypothetical protein